MILTDELKKKLKKAKSKEEAKQILQKAGVQLTDEDLEKVAGGGVPEIMGLQGGDGSDDDPWWHKKIERRERKCRKRRSAANVFGVAP